MRWIATVAILGAVLAPRPLAAQQAWDVAWRQCARVNPATPAADQAAGCTTVIESGRPNSDILAIAFNNRGNARRTLRNPTGAMADYDEALRLNPAYGNAYVNRGLLRRAGGDRSGALADYDEGLRLSPANATGFVARANIRRELGNREGALADFSDAIRLNPANALALNNRGHLRAAMGDAAGAIADFDVAILINPAYAEALASRGMASHSLGLAKASGADFEAAIRHAAPATNWPFIARAWTAMRDGDHGAAMNDLGEALRRAPGSALAHALRAILRAREGDPAGAATDAATARRLNPRIEAALAENFGPGLTLP